MLSDECFWTLVFHCGQLQSNIAGARKRLSEDIPEPDEDTNNLRRGLRVNGNSSNWQFGLFRRGQAADVKVRCRRSPGVDEWEQPVDVDVAQRFNAGKHVDRTVTIDRFERPVDNLWALAIGLDAVRLNELRGLDDVARQVYQALPAPRQKSPWEVLGLPSNSDLDVIEAVYRTKAKRLHPDTGGSPEAFKELQEAYEAVKRG